MTAVRDKPKGAELSVKDRVALNVHFLSKGIAEQRGTGMTLGQGIQIPEMISEHEVIAIDPETGLIGPAGDYTRAQRGIFRSSGEDEVLIDYEFSTPKNPNQKNQIVDLGDYLVLPKRLALTGEITPQATTVFNQTIINLFGPLFPKLRAALEKVKDDPSRSNRIAQLINQLEKQLP